MSSLQNAIAVFRKEIIDKKNQFGWSKNKVKKSILEDNKFSGWKSSSIEIIDVVYDYSRGVKKETLIQKYPHFASLPQNIKSWILGINVRPHTYSPVSVFAGYNNVNEISVDSSKGFKIVADQNYIIGLQFIACDSGSIVVLANHKNSFTNKNKYYDQYMYIVNYKEGMQSVINITEVHDNKITVSLSEDMVSSDKCGLTTKDSISMPALGSNGYFLMYHSSSINHQLKLPFKKHDLTEIQYDRNHIKNHGCMAKFTGSDKYDLIVTNAFNGTLSVNNFKTGVNFIMDLPDDIFDGNQDIKTHNIGDVSVDGFQDIALFVPGSSLAIVVFGNAEEIEIDELSFDQEIIQELLIEDGISFKGISMVVHHPSGINQIGHMIGDFDGDGNPDFLVSVTTNDTSQYSEIYVVYGGKNAFVSPTFSLGNESNVAYTKIFSTPLKDVKTCQPYAWGFSDLNNDGYGDAVISFINCQSERVTVLYGRPRVIRDLNLDLVYNPSNREGFSISGAGGDEFGSYIQSFDFNGDEVRDLLVGAPAINSTLNSTIYCFLSE